MGERRKEGVRGFRCVLRACVHGGWVGVPITAKKKRGHDKWTTCAINMLRATANTSCIILLSKCSPHAAVTRCAPASVATSKKPMRSGMSAGTYRSRGPAAPSEAPQPRKLTTFSASDRRLCVSTALTPMPLNKQSSLTSETWITSKRGNLTIQLGLLQFSCLRA